MPTNRETLLCRYYYDPLDRLVACSLSEQASTQRFYLKDRLTTEIQDQVHRSIFQHEDQLLAQQQRQDSTVETTLLATDQQRSVLNALDATRPHPLAYTPYGHRPPENGLFSLLGFNGERPDPVTGHYLLGNGYRAFNPVLMRFNSPDSWSPFGEGGLNAYAYCLGDPVNMEDREGHAPGLFARMLARIGIGNSKRSLPRSLSKKPLISSTDSVSVMTPTGNSTPSGKSSESLVSTLPSNADAGAHVTIPAEPSTVQIKPSTHFPIRNRSTSLETLNEERIGWARNDLESATRNLSTTVDQAKSDVTNHGLRTAETRKMYDRVFTHANDVATRSNYLSDLRKYPFGNTGKVRQIRKKKQP